MSKVFLPGNYIAGFVDGEGCFYLNYRSERKLQRKGQPRYFRWTPYFAIVLRKDDSNILELIKNTLNCGTLSFSGNTVRYNVQDMEDIIKRVIPFFNQYPLRAKKRTDFELWSKAAYIVYQHFSNRGKLISGTLYSENEHKTLISIRNSMREFKSKRKGEYKNSPIFAGNSRT